jgi:hypothetical protein
MALGDCWLRLGNAGVAVLLATQLLALAALHNRGAGEEAWLKREAIVTAASAIVAPVAVPVFEIDRALS